MPDTTFWKLACWLQALEGVSIIFTAISHACLHCHENAYCHNGGCKCKKGYKGDGIDCKGERNALNFLTSVVGLKQFFKCCNEYLDVNECLDGTAKCSADAFCQNVPGSHLCDCQPGFAGNGFTCHKDKGDFRHEHLMNWFEAAENWKMFIKLKIKFCTFQSIVSLILL